MINFVKLPPKPSFHSVDISNYRRKISPIFVCDHMKKGHLGFYGVIVCVVIETSSNKEGFVHIVGILWSTSDALVLVLSLFPVLVVVYIWSGTSLAIVKISKERTVYRRAPIREFAWRFGPGMRPSARNCNQATTSTGPLQQRTRDPLPIHFNLVFFFVTATSFSLFIRENNSQTL